MQLNFGRYWFGEQSPSSGHAPYVTVTESASGPKFSPSNSTKSTLSIVDLPIAVTKPFPVLVIWRHLVGPTHLLPRIRREPVLKLGAG